MVVTDVYCYHCNWTGTFSDEENVPSCPKCGNEDLSRINYIKCEQCGNIVYLDSFTNECDECEALYNKFGQRLKDPSEWDPEDKFYQEV